MRPRATNHGTASAQPPSRPRVFLLSPAKAGGVRSAMLVRRAAQFDLALQLRSPEGAPLGEVFRFMSGLYFRGKLEYARAFARPPPGTSGALVMAPGRGLVPVDARVRPDDLAAFARVPVDARSARFAKPLREAALELAARLGEGDAVLLGSFASGKYVDVLLEPLGERLLVPPAFAGRGDMSRGGLLLRSVRAGMELEVVPLVHAPRHGPRPPRLPPVPRKA